VFAVTDGQGHDVEAARIVDEDGRVIASQSDGRAVELNPGSYLLHVSAPGHAEVTERVVVHESEKNRMVRLVLPPEASPIAASSAKGRAGAGWFGKPIPTMSWVFGGVAAAGGLVAGVSGLLYLRTLHTFNDNHCRQPAPGAVQQCNDLGSRGRTYAAVDWVAGGGALASLAVAIIAYTASEPSPAEHAQHSERPLQWQASASPGSAGVQLTAAF
jgi:hypothetical protein